MGHHRQAGDPYPHAPWTYREMIDEANSAIRVRGRVDRLGVDQLRGTIEELSRQGHRHITVAVEHLDDVDTVAVRVLAEVAAALEAAGGRLTVQWSPADEGDDDPDLVIGAGHGHPETGSPRRAGPERRHRLTAG